MSGIIGGIKGTMKKKLSAQAGSGVDPHWNNVTLLLNGDSLADLSSSPKTVSVSGSASVNTSTKKFGTGSYYFNGSSYLIIPGGSHLDFGTGDFTIEFWVNLVSISGSWSGGYLTTWHIPGASSSNGWSISSSNNSSFDVSFGGMLNSSSNYGMTGVSLSSYANTWVHYAVVRSGSTLTQYLNGVAQNTYNIGTTPIYYPSTELWVGAWGAGFNGINGYMDDIRITKGVARYTANFTPPTAAFPTGTASTGSADANIGSVSLLLSGNGTNGSTTFTDSSPRAAATTVAGNAQISTAVKKYGTGSMYFDGSGDYVYVSTAASAFDYSTSNFTIEFWVYPLSGPASTYNPSFYTQHGDGDWSNGSLGIRIHHQNVLVGSSQITYSTAVSNNQWTHMALVRNGNTVTMYLNGNSVGSISYSGSLGSSTDRPALATSDSVASGGREFLNGYIDDLRITKGVARYTSNFTPPTSALPAA
jgi:hypothetical protein